MELNRSSGQVSSPLLDYQPVIDKLRTTFKNGVTKDINWRKNQLLQVQKMLNEKADDILKAVNKDLGRSFTEGFLGEIGSTLDDIKFILQNLDTWVKPIDRPQPMMQKPGSSQIWPQPKGVVLIIGAWNFPINLVIAPLCGAIAAGCCCVVKPSEVSPNCAALVGDLISEYLDPAAVQVIQGAVPETTALLKLRWDHIMYTGNGTVGRIVMQAASKHLTPVTLELGGKSPAFVDKDVNIDVACRRILSGKFFNNGQVCIAPDYLLVHKDVADKIINKLKSTVIDFYGKDPQKSKSLGRMVNAKHFNRVKSLVNNSGGKIIHGGLEGCDEKDLHIPPTFIRDPSFDSRIMNEEIFGPVLPIVVVDNMDAAINIVNDKDKPLALYIFSSNTNTVNKILSNTSSGGCCVNDTIFHVSNPNLPFGGVGASGMGAYHGKDSFDTFSHFRSVMNRSTWLDPSQRYPPYTEENLALIRKIMSGNLIPPVVKKIVIGGAILGGAAFIHSRL